MFDIGVGYFAPLNQRKKAFFNFMAGYQFGPMASKVEGGGTIYYFNGRANKIYVSPGFNFFNSPYFRMAFAPSFSILKYNNIKTNYTEERLETLQLNKLYKEVFTFFEPSMAFQFGFRNNKWLKLDLGLNFASNPNLYVGSSIFDDSQNIKSRNFIMSTGISVYPQRKKK